MDVKMASLVQNDGGLVSRRVFRDLDVYECEQERVFGKSWLFLGHESQLATSGDFFTTYMGEQPILVTRDETGTIHAFLNTCRHRGMMVCRADRGNAAAFTCSYHAWTFKNNGTLIGVPLHKDAYYGELDQSEWGLIPVAQLDTYKGLIFATFNTEAPSLVDSLGDMAWYLDTMLDRREGGTEVITGLHKWEAPANWKFFADNQIGDLYHVPFSHGSALTARGSDVESQRSFINNRPGTMRFEIRPVDGCGVGGRYVGADAPIADRFPPFRDPLIEDYYQSVHAETLERLGPVRARVVLSNGTIFPNFSILPSNFSIRIAHPRGPGKMEVWSWCIVDKAAPPEVKDAIRRSYLRSFGPGGLLEQDDGENWERATQGAMMRGAVDYPFNYEMGMGHEFYHDDLPGVIGKAESEGNQRGFYRRWSACMNEPAYVNGNMG